MRTGHLRRALRFAAVGAVVLAGAAATASGVAPSAGPAEIVGQLELPGASDRLLRPSALCFDPLSDEILVADPGHSRIVAFDSEGSYRFEFGLSNRHSVPLDIAVDSQGLIHVLASSQGTARLFLYDFDGLFLGEQAETARLTAAGGATDEMGLCSLSVDEEDRLILLDQGGPRLIVIESAGAQVSSFPILSDIERRVRDEIIFGAIDARGGQVHVPVSSMGFVVVYDIEGRWVRSYGVQGGSLGEMSLPAAVTVTEDLTYVLDKHRHNVLCFASSGRFLGEFGGRGISKGWFYHPTLLAAGGEGAIFVGQIFENRVQICRLPESVRANATA